MEPIKEEDRLSNGAHLLILRKGLLSHTIKTSSDGASEASRRSFYIPRLEKRMKKLLGTTAKKYASPFLQLKVGHGAVGGYTEPWMLVVWQKRTVFWTLVSYMKCRRWRKESRKLIRRLCAEETSWEGRMKRKGLAELLANEKDMGPLLEFLKLTEAGGEKVQRREG